MQDVDAVRAAFTDPDEFWSSPLYRQLCAAVAADPYLVELAAHARDGQVPTFAFLGAVHALLLAGADHPLAAYYPSLRGDDALPPAAAGPALTSFAHRYESDLVEIVSTRLVQTNQQLETQWRSEHPPPDLDAVPVIASTCGIDLNPLDPSDDDDRRWLEALVWPEDREKAALLHDALTLARDVPVEVLAGDAETLCGPWSAGIPHGDVRIVFHCATRMHVPVDRRAGFDQAISDIADDGPLFHVAIEGDGIRIAEPGATSSRRFNVEGHLAWAAPAD